jgi:pimeloyl-ACP methyl ester carboxylesterase
MITREFIEVEPGVKIHIRDWGNGKPIVLIPGWPLSDEMYDYQMIELAEKGFRPISITQRGFGKSDQPWLSYNYNIFADDIKVVLDQLDLKDVVLCGHSMGGAIAIHYMDRYKGKRIGKLALFGAAAPSWTKCDGHPHGLEKTEVDKLIKGIDTDRPKLIDDFGKIFGLNETSINQGLSTWIHQMGMNSSTYAMKQCLIALRDNNLSKSLNEIMIPTAIFHAVKDKICPFAFAEEMNNSIKKSRIIRFEKSGHGLFIEEKEKFNMELIKFVNES